MLLPPRRDDVEVVAEERRKLPGGVPDPRQNGAAVGAILSEDADHSGVSRRESGLQSLDVTLLIVVIDQELENGPSCQRS